MICTAGAKYSSVKGGRAIFLGGILLLAMLIISTLGIFGAVFLYNSSPLKPYPIEFINRIALFWIPVPNYGYSVFFDFISDLGVGPSSFIFNTGMIIAGALNIPVYPTLIKPLGSTTTAKIGAVTGIIASIGLIGVGVFTETTGFTHVLFATTFFFLIFITAGLVSYANNSTHFFSKNVQRLGYCAFLGGLICTALVAIFGPPPEWVLLLIMLIWALPLSREMLAKGKSL